MLGAADDKCKTHGLPPRNSFGKIEIMDIGQEREDLRQAERSGGPSFRRNSTRDNTLPEDSFPSRHGGRPIVLAVAN